MKIKFPILILVLVLSISSCGKKEEQTQSSDDLKKKELELKEKELQLKERELLEKKDSELREREKDLTEKKSTNQEINLTGSYWGSIKDGTSWYVYISEGKGKNIKGYNKIYWESSPEGYKTNFSGTYDPSARKIIMYEDRNAKGSGKFIGTVSVDGKSISGDWYRYSDNGSFTWNLEKSEEEDQ